SRRKRFFLYCFSCRIRSGAKSVDSLSFSLIESTIPSGLDYDTTMSLSLQQVVAPLLQDNTPESIQALVPISSRDVQITQEDTDSDTEDEQGEHSLEFFTSTTSSPLSPTPSSSEIMHWKYRKARGVKKVRGPNGEKISRQWYECSSKSETM